jgi:hypothetical protein
MAATNLVALILVGCVLRSATPGLLRKGKGPGSAKTSQCEITKNDGKAIKIDRKQPKYKQN